MYNMIEILNPGDAFQIHDVTFWRIVKSDSTDYKILSAANSLKEFYEKEVNQKLFSFCLNHFIRSYQLYQSKITPLFVLDMLACHNAHIIYKVLSLDSILFLLIDIKRLQESIIIL